MRKRRIGNRLGALGLAIGLLALAPAIAKEKKKPPETALVFGTVFRETGMSLPGAEVEIAAADAGVKFKKQRATSDARGEFAFQVPTTKGKYLVRVKAQGYGPAEKQVEVEGLVRVDVFFRLERASK